MGRGIIIIAVKHGDKSFANYNNLAHFTLSLLINTSIKNLLLMKMLAIL